MIFVADDTIQPLNVTLNTVSQTQSEPVKQTPIVQEKSKPIASPAPQAEPRTLPKTRDEEDGLPLTIQDLLSDKGTLRLEASTVFSSTETSDTDSLYNVIQTGDGQFISVPVAVGTERRNSDILLATLGARYGLTKDAELVLKGTALVSDNRSIDLTGVSSTTNEQQISTLALGLNHRISDDNETPALLGFAELTAAENTATSGHDFVFFRTGTIGHDIPHN